MWHGGDRQQEIELEGQGYQLRGDPLEGINGHVWEAEQLNGLMTVAIKILQPTYHKRQYVEREAEIRDRLLPGHRNVLQWYYAFTDLQHGVYVVMEMSVLGDINRYMRMHAPDGLPRITRQYIFKQIVDGLHYIHGFLICHGNLRPSNILLFRETPEKLIAKISNFGAARVYRENSCLRGVSGVPAYSAPETRFHQARYRPEPIDVYSLGIILYYMMLARIPVSSPIHHRGGFLTSLIPATGSDVLERSMIQRLTHEDPATRSTIAMIQKHPYYRTADGERLPVTVTHRFRQTMSTIGALVLLEYQEALNMPVQHGGNNNNNSRRRRRNSGASPHSPRCRSTGSVCPTVASQKSVRQSPPAQNSRRSRSRSRRRGGLTTSSPSSTHRHRQS